MFICLPDPAICPALTQTRFRPVQAVSAAASLVESKLGKELKKFLKKNIVKKELTDELGVADSKLGGIIKDKLGVQCVADSTVMELQRGIRSQLTNLVEGLDDDQLRAMQLGLSHTLSRYKLKFSPDKDIASFPWTAVLSSSFHLSPPPLSSCFRSTL